MECFKVGATRHRRKLGIVGIVPALGLLLAACGAPAPGNGGVEPTPTPGPGDEPLSHVCITTEIAPMGPYLVRQGEPLPTGFDQVNTGGCTFNKPVTTITLVLLREDDPVLERVVELDTSTDEVGLPFVEGAAGDAPADLATGRYGYQLRATATTGETVTILDREFWVFRAEGTPEDLARQDLAERLGVDAGDLMLSGFTHQEWPDASLGCPQPGEMYAQVITPGWRVVLVHDHQQYPYHTNEDATAVKFCPEANE